MDKNRINYDYLRLLQCALWDTDMPMDEAIDYGPVIQLAMRQGTGPLVMDRVLSLTPGLSPAERGDVGLKMKQLCMQNMLQQEQMKAVMEKTLAALAEGGVEATVFKGFALAQLYPKPYLRQWGDIDIYVGDKGYHQAAEILRKTWPDCPCFETEEDYFKHWNIIADGVSIEAHRVSITMSHPMDKRVWKELEEKGMGRAQTPEERFNLLLVFIHSWHHYTESRSANIKQVCDVAMCIKKMNSSVVSHRATGYLKKNLRKLRLTQVWEAYAWILVKYLGVEAEQCPLYNPRAEKRGKRLLENILHPDKKYDKPGTKVYKNMILRKLNTLRVKMAASMSLREIAPGYALHDMVGKVLDGVGRMLRGEMTRKWE